MARIELDDLNITFDVADTRHRFTFMLMGEYDPRYSQALDGYLIAAPVHTVPTEAVKWVLGRLWRHRTAPSS
jgi:hypothetical protein